MISQDVLKQIKPRDHILYETGLVNPKTLAYEWRSGDVDSVLRINGEYLGLSVKPTDNRAPIDERYGELRTIGDRTGEIYRLGSGNQMPNGVISQLDDIVANDWSAYPYDISAFKVKVPVPSAI